MNALTSFPISVQSGWLAVGVVVLWLLALVIALELASRIWDFWKERRHLEGVARRSLQARGADRVRLRGVVAQERSARTAAGGVSTPYPRLATTAERARAAGVDELTRDECADLSPEDYAGLAEFSEVRRP